GYMGPPTMTLRSLGATRVSRITIDGILAYRQDRLEKGCSPRTVNIDVGALSTMLRWAEAHQLIGSNPLAKLKPLPHDHPKEGRALSDDEVHRLLDKSPPPWLDIWYALLVTGLRKEELASLTFKDIDWDAHEIIVRMGVAKSHRERRLTDRQRPMGDPVPTEGRSGISSAGHGQNPKDNREGREPVQPRTRVCFNAEYT